MNFRLRLAVDNAKAQNMPKDTIERAIAKGAGIGADGTALEELTYEAYGPGGTGLIIQTLTDNRNRAASGIRSKVTRSGGNLAANGAVSWNFEQKGLVTLEVEGADPEEVALEVMDIGAEDVDIEEDLVSITFPFSEFARAKTELESFANVRVESAELAMIPNNMIFLEKSQAVQPSACLTNWRTRRRLESLHQRRFPRGSPRRVPGPTKLSPTKLSPTKLSPTKLSPTK